MALKLGFGNNQFELEEGVTFKMIICVIGLMCQTQSNSVVPNLLKISDHLVVRNEKVNSAFQGRVGEKIASKREGKSVKRHYRKKVRSWQLPLSIPPCLRSTLTSQKKFLREPLLPLAFFGQSLLGMLDNLELEPTLATSQYCRIIDFFMEQLLNTPEAFVAPRALVGSHWCKSVSGLQPNRFLEGLILQFGFEFYLVLQWLEGKLAKS